MEMVKIRFGEFLLDEARYALLRSGEVVALRPKVFDLLVHLARHADRVVRREELVRVVWGGTRVGAGSLAGLVNELRRALGEHGRGASVIRTVHARGYQFVGDARDRADAPTDAFEAAVAEATAHASAIGPFGLVMEAAGLAASDAGLEAFVARGFEVLRVSCRSGIPMTPAALSRAIVDRLVEGRKLETVAAALPLPARRWLETERNACVAGGWGPARREPPGGLTAVAAGVARCAGASPLVLVLEAVDTGSAECARALGTFFDGLGSAPVVVLLIADGASREASQSFARVVGAAGFRFVPNPKTEVHDGTPVERRVLDAWRYAWALESIPAPVEAALIGHLRGDRPLSRVGVVAEAAERRSDLGSSDAEGAVRARSVAGPVRPGVRRVEPQPRDRRAESDGC